MCACDNDPRLQIDHAKFPERCEHFSGATSMPQVMTDGTSVLPDPQARTLMAYDAATGLYSDGAVAAGCDPVEIISGTHLTGVVANELAYTVSSQGGAPLRWEDGTVMGTSSLPFGTAFKGVLHPHDLIEVTSPPGVSGYVNVYETQQLGPVPTHATGWDLFHDVFGTKDPFHGGRQENRWQHHHDAEQHHDQHRGFEHEHALHHEHYVGAIPNELTYTVASRNGAALRWEDGSATGSGLLPYGSTFKGVLHPHDLIEVTSPPGVTGYVNVYETQEVGSVPARVGFDRRGMRQGERRGARSVFGSIFNPIGAAIAAVAKGGRHHGRHHHGRHFAGFGSEWTGAPEVHQAAAHANNAVAQAHAASQAAAHPAAKNTGAHGAAKVATQHAAQALGHARAAAASPDRHTATVHANEAARHAHAASAHAVNAHAAMHEGRGHGVRQGGVRREFGVRRGLGRGFGRGFEGRGWRGWRGVGHPGWRSGVGAAWRGYRASCWRMLPWGICSVEQIFEPGGNFAFRVTPAGVQENIMLQPEEEQQNTSYVQATGQQPPTADDGPMPGSDQSSDGSQAPADDQAASDQGGDQSQTGDQGSGEGQVSAPTDDGSGAGDSSDQGSDQGGDQSSDQGSSEVAKGDFAGWEMLFTDPYGRFNPNMPPAWDSRYAYYPDYYYGAAGETLAGVQSGPAIVGVQSGPAIVGVQSGPAIVGWEEG